MTDSSKFPDKLPSRLPAEAEVAAYLAQDPDFFHRHQRLLSSLNLPHEAGPAISLIERQVAVLRERNVETRRQMNELISAGQANDALFAKVRSLTLAMLDVSDWLELNEIYATYLLVDFKADFVCSHVLQGPRHQPGRFDHIVGHIDTLPQQRLALGEEPVCTPLRIKELRDIFPAERFDADNELAAVGSAVLIPLNVHPGGYLAIGSRDVDRFTTDMDTLFVAYISDLVSHITARLLQ